MSASLSIIQVLLGEHPVMDVDAMTHDVLSIELSKGAYPFTALLLHWNPRQIAGNADEQGAEELMPDLKPTPREFQCNGTVAR
jgi:hypothetical protein